eukprot:6228655-Heterocapsa_arctica.AAC.1
MPLEEGEKELDEACHRRYRALVGKLMWLSSVRPDLGYTIKELARSLQTPTAENEACLKRVLRYLISTKHY